MKQVILKNGLRVAIDSNDSPAVELNLSLNGGFVFEDRDSVGVFSLIQSIIIDYLKEKDFINFKLDVYEILSNINISKKFLSEDLIKSLDEVASIFNEDIFTEERINRVKKSFISDKGFKQNFEEDFLWKEGLFKAGSLDLSYDKNLREIIENMPVQKIRDYFNKYYNSNNMAMAISGDFDENKLKPLLDKTIGNIRKGREHNKPKVKSVYPIRFITHNDSVSYSLSFKTNKKLDLELMLLNQLLFNQINEKLRFNTRDKSIYTALLYKTYVGNLKNIRITTMFKEGKKELIDKAIFDTLDDITYDRLNPSDILSAINNLQSNLNNDISMRNMSINMLRHNSPLYLPFSKKTIKFSDIQYLASHLLKAIKWKPKWYKRRVIKKYKSSDTKFDFVYPKIEKKKAGQVQKTVLNNGLTIITREIKGKVPECEMQIGVGSQNDPNNAKGAFHYLEHLIAKTFDDLVGIYNIYACTSRDDTKYGISRQSIFAMLDIMYQSIFSPDLSPETILEEKEPIEVEILEYSANQVNKRGDLVMQSAYGNSNFGKNVLGSKESISNITSEILTECHSKYVPANCTLVVIGEGVNHEHVVDLGKNIFGQIPYQEPEVLEDWKFQSQDIEVNGDENPFLSISFELTPFIKKHLLETFLLENIISEKLYEKLEDEDMKNSMLLSRNASFFKVESLCSLGNSEDMKNKVLEVINNIEISEDDLSKSVKYQLIKYANISNNHSIPSLLDIHDNFQEIYSFDEYQNRLNEISLETIQGLLKEFKSAPRSSLIMDDLDLVHTKREQRAQLENVLAPAKEKTPKSRASIFCSKGGYNQPKIN